MELISRDDLYKVLWEDTEWYNNADRDEIALEAVMNAPTVDAIPVEWLTIQIEEYKKSIDSAISEDEEYIKGYKAALDSICSLIKD